MNDEYIPAPSRNATRFVVQTPRIRIIDMSTSGSLLWSSTQIQAAITAAPAASSAIVLVPPQPQTVVCAIAISSAADPEAHQRRRKPVAGRASAPATRAHSATWRARQQGDHKRSPEQPVPAQVLDDHAPSTSPRPPPTPEDRGDDADAAGNPVERKLVADDRERQREDPARDALDHARDDQHRQRVRRARPAASRPRAPAASYSSSRCLPYMSPSLPMIAVPTEADSRKPVSSQVTPVSLVCRCAGAWAAPGSPRSSAPRRPARRAAARSGSRSRAPHATPAVPGTWLVH